MGLTSKPVDRAGPPYHMTEMIAAEPALAGRSSSGSPAGPAAGAAGWPRRSAAAAAGAPIVVTGCGTCEHGALGRVEILRDAMRSAGLRGPAR